ncbi:MAG: hypothetical protein EPO35_03215 [Acidobacteria bacterium]|nr:MAG: hypothetical protein EPO35_03215 [Acidobacteriota bacterium]
MNLRVLLGIVLITGMGQPALAQPAQPPLSRARQAYNAGQFDAAIAAAAEARKTPALVNSANLVLSRSHLERFRVQSEPTDLATAHDLLNLVEPARLSPAERQDYTVGLGIAVYFEGRPGAAAELFEALLDTPASAPAPLLGARRALFDWWATAADRAAQLAPDAGRRDFYVRILSRGQSELARDPSSTAAGYWIAAAARGTGDLDRAWHAAIAAWIRSRTAPDRVTARADLDLLVTTAIIPERARSLDAHDSAALVAAMRAEWEQIKTSW